jgi:hypothetical protein
MLDVSRFAPGGAPGFRAVTSKNGTRALVPEILQR